MELERCIFMITDDIRETVVLFQRLSVPLHGYIKENAVSFCNFRRTEQ